MSEPRIIPRGELRFIRTRMGANLAVQAVARVPDDGDETAPAASAEVTFEGDPVTFEGDQVTYG